jgi:hypothetical protein
LIMVQGHSWTEKTSTITPVSLTRANCLRRSIYSFIQIFQTGFWMTRDGQDTCDFSVTTLTIQAVVLGIGFGNQFCCFITWS